VRLDAANAAVVLDSTADFPDAPQRFSNWRVVPLYVRFGDESRKDYVEMSPEEFYTRLRSSTELPTTSQPTPGDFAATYDELAGFDRIYVLTIAAILSGTNQSARLAAAEHADRVRVIDTESASAGVALLALALQRRLERGTTDDEVGALIERYKQDARLLFTVDTLEYLQRGGRIGRAAAFAGTLLHIKPILTIDAGEVVPVKRVRGNQKAVQEFRRAFEEATEDVSTLRVGIAAADAPERIEAMRALIRDVRPHAQIDVATTLGPVVGTHAGPGTVGFFWFDDSA